MEAVPGGGDRGHQGLSLVLHPRSSFHVIQEATGSLSKSLLICGTFTFAKLQYIAHRGRCGVSLCQRSSDSGLKDAGYQDQDNLEEENGQHNGAPFWQDIATKVVHQGLATSSEVQGHSRFVVVVVMERIVMDMGVDAWAARLGVAAAPGHIIMGGRPRHSSSTPFILDELLVHPRDMEPVRVAVIAAATVGSLEEIHFLFDVRRVSVVLHGKAQTPLERVVEVVDVDITHDAPSQHTDAHADGQTYVGHQHYAELGTAGGVGAEHKHQHSPAEVHDPRNKPHPYKEVW